MDNINEFSDLLKYVEENFKDRKDSFSSQGGLHTQLNKPKYADKKESIVFFLFKENDNNLRLEKIWFEREFPYRKCEEPQWFKDLKNKKGQGLNEF